MVNHRFGELRPDIWMRPANTPAPSHHTWIVISGDLTGRDQQQLIAQLWDLPMLAAAAEGLVLELDSLHARLDWDDAKSIPEAFTASARVVRFLRSEPQVPAELQPGAWPMNTLRQAYDAFEHKHLGLLNAFLRHGMSV